MINIAIADDEALFRSGISMLLQDDDISVVLEAEHGQDLLDKLQAASEIPDVLLLDLNMPVLNGIEAAKTIRETYPDLKIIILSSHYSKAFITNMLEIGAAAYLAKNASPDEMELTIREVYAKGFYYDQHIMEVIRENMMNKTRPPKSSASFAISLTQREQEILQLICEEKTTPEIAEQLFISRRTVEGHRNNLLSKLGCRNTAGLVVVAIQENLVDVKKLRF
jgi:DNA-binding NarL/FixJ family response regulator